MRHIHISLALVCLLIIVACGQSQANDLATRGALRAPTIALPTPTPPPQPAVTTAAEAIRIARGVVSPYLATWQDVVASEDGGVWRIQFRHYEPLPPDAPALEEYWRIPLSVFIDAQTGIVLRQVYL